MKVIDTKNAPGAIGPYSQGFITNGLVFTSGQIPVNPANGEVPEGITAQTECSRYLGGCRFRNGQSCKDNMFPCRYC